MRMRLVKLKLENIASYGKRDNELEFEGLSYPIFVSGPNGAGKTTFFVDGVTFALFSGAYGRGPRGRESSKRLITPAGRHVSGSVDLVFSAGEDIYRVIRREIAIGKNRSWENILYILKDGKWVKEAVGDEVDSRIRSIVGFDYNTFLSSVVIRQGEVFSFIEAKDFERRDLLLKLLNIEFDRFRSLIREKIGGLKTDIEVLKGRLAEKKGLLRFSSIEELDKEFRRLVKRSEKIDSQINGLEKELKELNTKKEVITKEISRLKTLYEQIRNLGSQIEELEKELRTTGYKGSLEDLESLEDVLTQIHRIRDEILFFDREKESLEKIIKKFDELRSIEEKLSENEERKKRVLEEIDKLGLEITEEAIRKLMELRGGIEARIQKITESMELLKRSTEPKCPVCGRDLDEEHRKSLLEDLENEFKTLSLEREDLEAKISEMKKYRELLHPIEDELSKLRMLYEYRKKELEDYKEEEIRDRIIKFEEEIVKNRDRVRSLLDKVCSFFTFECGEDNIDILNESLNRCREISTKITVLREERSRVMEEFDEHVYKRLMGEYEKIESEISSISDRRDKLLRESESIKSLLRDLDMQRKIFMEIDEMEGELGRLEASEKIWSLLRDYVFAESMFPRSLLKDIVENFLTAEVNRMLSMIFPNASIRLTVSEEGRGISLSVYINNIFRERLTLSGGEKTLIGFAIRLGITSLVTQLHSRGSTPDFLIIDEGFGPLDEENKNLIAELMGTLVNTGIYSQVIVISHEAELKNHPVFRSVIEVDKEGGYSRLRLRI